MTGWFSLTGRLSRRRFWADYLLPLAALFVLGAMLDEALLEADLAWPDRDGGLLSGLAALVGLLGLLIAFVRRLHDLDIHGGWILLILGVPAIGPLLALLLLGTLPGSPRANRFGPRPPP